MKQNPLIIRPSSICKCFLLSLIFLLFVAKSFIYNTKLVIADDNTDAILDAEAKLNISAAIDPDQTWFMQTSTFKVVRNIDGTFTVTTPEKKGSKTVENSHVPFTDLNQTEQALFDKLFDAATAAGKPLADSDINNLKDKIKSNYDIALNFSFGCHGNAGTGQQLLNSGSNVERSWFNNQFETFTLFDIEFNTSVNSNLFDGEQYYRYGPVDTKAERIAAKAEHIGLFTNTIDSTNTGVTLSQSNSFQSAFITPTDVLINSATGKSLTATDLINSCISRCLKIKGNTQSYCKKDCNIARCGCRDTDKNGTLEAVCEPGQFGAACLGVMSCNVRTCDNLANGQSNQSGKDTSQTNSSTNTNNSTINVAEAVFNFSATTSCQGSTCVNNSSNKNNEVNSYSAWLFGPDINSLLKLDTGNPFLSNATSLFSLSYNIPNLNTIILQTRGMNGGENEVRLTCNCK